MLFVFRVIQFVYTFLNAVKILSSVTRLLWQKRGAFYKPVVSGCFALFNKNTLYTGMQILHSNTFDSTHLMWQVFFKKDSALHSPILVESLDFFALNHLAWDLTSDLQGGRPATIKGGEHLGSSSVALPSSEETRMGFTGFLLFVFFYAFDGVVSSSMSSRSSSCLALVAPSLSFWFGLGVQWLHLNCCISL